MKRKAETQITKDNPEDITNRKVTFGFDRADEEVLEQREIVKVAEKRKESGPSFSFNTDFEFKFDNFEVEKPFPKDEKTVTPKEEVFSFTFDNSEDLGQEYTPAFPEMDKALNEIVFPNFDEENIKSEKEVDNAKEFTFGDTLGPFGQSDQLTVDIGKNIGKELSGIEFPGNVEEAENKTLAGVQARSGEEDENIEFKSDGKLFFLNTNRVKWDDHGMGDLTLNVSKNDKSARLIMRMKDTFSVILNTMLFKGCPIKPFIDPGHVEKQNKVTFSCVNKIDTEKEETVLISFKNNSDCENFQSCVKKYI